jgi:hypothetical protein
MFYFELYCNTPSAICTLMMPELAIHHNILHFCQIE